MDSYDNQKDFENFSGGDLAGNASVRDVVAILFIHKWVIFVSFIILLSAIFWGLSLRQAFFVSTVEYYVDRSFSNQMGITYTPGMDYEEEMNSIAELGRSQGVLNSFARGFDRARGWENPSAEQSKLVAGALAEYIEISPVPETNMIQIRVRDADPDTALMIADLFSTAFQEEYIRIHRPEFGREFVQKNIDQLENRIREANEAKAELQADALLFDMRVVETRMAENKAIFERQLTDTRIKLRTLESQIERDNDVYDEFGGEMIPSIGLRTDPLVERYTNRLADLKMSLSHLESKYMPDYPLVIAKKEEIKKVNEQKDRAINLSIQTRTDKLEGLKESERILSDTISELETRLREMPKNAGGIQYYEEFLKMQWNLYARLITKFNDKLVDEEFTIMDKKLVKLGDPVISDIEGLTPPLIYALVAPLFAFVLAISSAFMVEATGQSFQKPADVEEFTGLPVFATFRKF